MFYFHPRCLLSQTFMTLDYIMQYAIYYTLIRSQTFINSTMFLENSSSWTPSLATTALRPYSLACNKEKCTYSIYYILLLSMYNNREGILMSPIHYLVYLCPPPTPWGEGVASRLIVVFHHPNVSWRPIPCQTLFTRYFLQFFCGWLSNSQIW